MYNFIYFNNKKYNIFSRKGDNILSNFLKASNAIKKTLTTQKTLKLVKPKQYFKKNNKLIDKKQKFCRCVLHVSKNNSNQCNKTREWKGKCYNPYTVCAASTKTTTGGKPCNYNFLKKDIPISEIKSYVYLNFKLYNNWAKLNNKKKIYQINSEKELRQNVNDWYNSKKLKSKLKPKLKPKSKSIKSKTKSKPKPKLKSKFTMKSKNK